MNANLVDAIKEMFDDTKEHLDSLFEIPKDMSKKDKFFKMVRNNM